MAGIRYKISPLSIRETSNTALPISGATVTVYLANTSTLATCYADTTTGTPLASSQTTTNSAGYFEFYVDSADYANTQKFKIVISKAGYSDITYDYLGIFPNLSGIRDPWVDIRAFGAVGDGATDCTTALTDALAVGRPVYIPEDTFYLATADISVPAGSIIFGPGTLKGNSAASAGSGVLLVDNNDVLIDGITVDLNNINAGRAVKVVGASRVTLRNLKTANIQQAFIYASGVVIDLWIEGCRHNSKGYGVFISDPSATSKGLTIINNEFFFSGVTGLGDGVEVNAPTNGMSNVVITNNRIKGYIGQASSAGIGIGVANCPYAIITDNLVESCEGDGIHLEAGSDYSTVANNTVKSIGVEGSTSTSSGIFLLNSEGCVVEGNIVVDVINAHGIIARGDRAASPALDYGNRIVNNIVKDIDKHGIRMAAQSGGLIQGNFVRNVNRDAGTFYGIDCARIDGSVTTVDNESLQVKDNHFKDDAGVMTRPINFGANVNESQCSGNDSSKLTNKSILNSAGAAVEVRGNRMSTDAMSGSFTLTAAATSKIVTNGNSWDTTHIRVFPLDAAAAAMTGVYLSAVTKGANFTLTHPSAAGGETFGYEML